MAFNQARNTGISRCVFNEIGRDQNQVEVRIEQMNIYLCDPSPDISLLPPHHDLPPHNGSDIDVLNSFTTPPEMPLSSNTFAPASHSLESISTSTSLIVKIVQLLIRPQQPDKHMDLRLELQALCESLMLIGATIQKYQDRPLGLSLINAVTPEVERCREVLGELSEIVHRTLQALEPTTIRDFWRPVWWGLWNGDDRALLKLKFKLCERRRLLCNFALAVDSYVIFGFPCITITEISQPVSLQSATWTDLGNDLLAGHVSLDTFFSTLRERLPALCHIKLESISVVDHLGQTIPLPTVFCSTWKVISCLKFIGDLRHLYTLGFPPHHCLLLRRPCWRSLCEAGRLSSHKCQG